MNLAAFADVHDDFAFVTDTLRSVGAVDVVVIAGDLTNCGTPTEVEAALAQWQLFAPRLVAVAGNMDSPAIDRALVERGVSIDGRCQVVGDVAFFGCSAAPVSIGTPYEIPEEEIAARIQRGFAQAQASGVSTLVFVPHAPPYGAVDRVWSGAHAGSRAVREFVDRHQPALVLCGHIHEARGQARLGNSVIVNCGPAKRGHYALVELTAKAVQVELR
ncbi:MAG TPA: metallophosphoesterase [Verrucomicrobiae bacterium]|nr:metallophosphoesterase [Verrucomicrobiae bacterium]